MTSKLILGTVQMGISYGINNTSGKVSLKDSLKILNYAFDNGIRILDSAEAYGDAHQVIGHFHKDNPSKRFGIITKFATNFNEDITYIVNKYLSDLKVDQLHALLFHSFSSYDLNRDKLHDLRKLKSDKKIRYLGVSVYTNKEIEKVIFNDDIDIIQVPFNLLDNSNLRGEIFEKAKAKGKIIHTRSALLQGLFFKKSSEKNRVVENLKDELTELSRISQQYNISISNLALGYCFQQPNINSVLVGVETLNQLKENISSVNTGLPLKIINEINSIKVRNPDFLNPSLWN